MQFLLPPPCGGGRPYDSSSKKNENSATSGPLKCWCETLPSLFFSAELVFLPKQNPAELSN